jgi:mono/diheme cytochrome c family protein
MRRILTLAFVALACLALPGVLAAQSDTRTTQDGVFNEAQRARGESSFKETCAACHSSSQFKGDAFVKAWSGMTVFDLFDQLRTTMPNDNPGGLPPATYVDVVTYLLGLNGFPRGDKALPPDEDALKRVRITPAGS